LVIDQMKHTDRPLLSSERKDGDRLEPLGDAAASDFSRVSAANCTAMVCALPRGRISGVKKGRLWSVRPMRRGHTCIHRSE
jgi:hypothetical protein